MEALGQSDRAYVWRVSHAPRFTASLSVILLLASLMQILAQGKPTPEELRQALRAFTTNPPIIEYVKFRTEYLGEYRNPAGTATYEGGWQPPNTFWLRSINDAYYSSGKMTNAHMENVFGRLGTTNWLIQHNYSLLNYSYRTPEIRLAAKNPVEMDVEHSTANLIGRLHFGVPGLNQGSIRWISEADFTAMRSDSRINGTVTGRFEFKATGQPDRLVWTIQDNDTQWEAVDQYYYTTNTGLPFYPSETVRASVVVTNGQRIQGPPFMRTYVSAIRTSAVPLSAELFLWHRWTNNRQFEYVEVYSNNVSTVFLKDGRAIQKYSGPVLMPPLWKRHPIVVRGTVIVLMGLALCVGVWGFVPAIVENAVGGLAVEPTSSAGNENQTQTHQPHEESKQQPAGPGQPQIV